MLRYEWVLYKERGTGFLNANRAPLKKSENILAFYRKRPVYNPQFSYGEPYKKVTAHSASVNYGKHERTPTESKDGRRYPGNVLFVPPMVNGIHPTQKPVPLFEYLIRTYTNEGDLVVDCCAGSGTAALATVTKISNTIRMLRDHALIGAPLSSIVDVESDYRFLTSGNYMIFYRVVGNDVFIDRVLYGRRDFLRVLSLEPKDHIPQ